MYEYNYLNLNLFCQLVQRSSAWFSAGFIAFDKTCNTDMSKYSSSSARGAAAVFAQNCTEFCEKSVENRGKQRNSPEKDAMSHEYIYIDVEL